MSKMNCCPGCPIHHTEVKEMPDLHSFVGALTDELLASRAAAEAVRDYLNRIIVKVDELMDVLDEADWEFSGEETTE
ncbi:MAG: hypothetical protein IJE08_08645 [Clostridia bacterium]|nr:hypothetical protein [Clostridia bacterium]